VPSGTAQAEVRLISTRNAGSDNDGYYDNLSLVAVDGSGTSSSVGFTDVAAGIFHSLAVDTGGNVWVAGQNDDGELGTGSTSSTDVGTWQQVTGISGISEVFADGEWSFALATDGTLYATGRNNYGQLGFGDTTDRSSWAQTRAGVAMVACSREHTFIVTTDDRLFAAGDNYWGEFGDATTTDSDSWREITIPDSDTDTSTTVFDMAIGREHSLLITVNSADDYKLWGTGHNGYSSDDYGSLGLGSTTTVNTWTEITAISNPRAVRAGDEYSLVLTDANTLFVTGVNADGQLGTGDTTSTKNWTQISSITGIQYIHAANDTSFIQTTDGTVYGTGVNYNGSLGLGDDIDRSSFTEIPSIAGAADISGMDQTLAILPGDELWVTGRNYDEQLGLGTDFSDQNNVLSWQQVQISQ
jgi:alpha-tubulin suppressor-like RCC1 family protein